MRIALKLADLTSDEKKILTLRYYENLTNTEIAFVLGTSIGDVENALKTILKKALKEEENER